MRALTAFLPLASLWGACDEPLRQRTGDVCVEITTGFVDLGGDTWTTNQPREGRGLEYELTDSVGVQTGNLDDLTGCADNLTIFLRDVDDLELRLETRAVVNGVAFDSWLGPDSTSKTFQAVVFNRNLGIATTFDETFTISSLDQRWINLAVAGMVFRDFDYNVDQANDRDCCLETAFGFVDDGTCPVPAAGGYALIADPIQLQTNNGASASCCGSSLTDNDPAALDPPGLNVPTSTPRKFLIAHELGHVIAGMRMGGKEWGQYPNDLPSDGCVADQQLNGTLIPDSGRGEFTKERVAVAMREGWADFVAAATWNDRAQDRCKYHVDFLRHDFDLDGVQDNNANLGGEFDCEGIPTLPGDPPVAAYLTARNWLEDVEDGDDDDVDGVQCARTGVTVDEENRSTVYDVLRMYWDLTTDHQLTPNQLSDLYVDTCARGWEELDPVSTNDALPLERLKISADFHAIDTEVQAELNHLEH